MSIGSRAWTGRGAHDARRGTVEAALVRHPLAVEEAADQRRRPPPRRSSRSPNPLPNSPRARTPDARRSNQPPPIPRIARPSLMWSTVVASFAVRPGLRNVFAATRRPMRARLVTAASADERRPALELRIVAVALVGEQVIVDPEVVRAGVLGRDDGVPKRRPVGPLDPERGADPDRMTGADGGHRAIGSASAIDARRSLALPPTPARRSSPGTTRAAGRSPSGSSRDPYAILVSEVMAQQTQVSPGRRGVAALPGAVPDGRRAGRGDAGRGRPGAWQGMGYDRRALNLRRAAQVIRDDHGGRVPDDIEALDRPPGRRAVHRSGGRCHRLRAGGRRGRHERSAGPDARSLAARRAPSSRPGVVQDSARTNPSIAVRPGDWTHALMDVGATVCRPQRPACDACPLRPWCAFRSSAAAAVAVRPRRVGASRRERGHAAGPLEPTTRGSRTTSTGFARDRQRLARSRGPAS